MANKVRTPPPPRRVQSPQQRVEKHDEKRTRYILIGVAALGIVGLLAVISLIAFGGGESASARDAIEAAGGTLEEVPASDAANHVDTPPKRSEYNTWPPTSGPHNPTPAPWGEYPEAVEQYRVVHNLEHGGVVIQYGDDVPQADIDAILAWYRNDPNGIIVAPFPELGDEITIGAWTSPASGTGGTAYLARLPGFDEDAFDAFVDAYGFRGPESANFPRELLTPGT